MAQRTRVEEPPLRPIPDARAERLAAVAAARLRHVRLAVEHVWHRHNTSALLRSADAFGVTDAHLVGERTFLPSVGAARGAARWVRCHDHLDAEAAVSVLRAAGVGIWVADLTPDAIPPEAVPLDRPVCLWLGAELVGPSAVARAAADGIVKLPMYGMVQSLNVSAAGTALLHVLTTRARAEVGPDALLPDEERRALLHTWCAEPG